MVPVVLYAAKSTDDVRGSIPTQLSDALAAVEREGDRDVVGEFQDNARSGFKGNRGDGLARAKAAAIKAAKEHGQAELWVQHSDRVARGSGDSAEAAHHLLEVYFELVRKDVRLRSVQDDSNLNNIITIAVSGEQNTGYSKRLSAATASGKARQLERGERLGGPVPDGLRIEVERDSQDKVIARRYVRDDERAKIIEEAFSLSEANHGDGVIARRLNAKGFRTQSGRTWSRRRIQDLLMNPVYAGRIVKNRGKPNEIVSDRSNVEALIDPARFDAILAKRSSRDRSKAGRELGMLGGTPTTRYALHKLARCDRCGGHMYCVTSPYKRKRDNNSQARHYVCAEVQDATGACDAPKVDAEAVDAAIVPHLREFFADYSSWAEEIRQSTSAERTHAEGTLRETQSELGRLRKAQDGLQARYVDALAAGDEEITAAQEQALAKITASISALELEELQLQEQISKLAEEISPTDSMLDYWRGIAEAITGRLDGAVGMGEINIELRATLSAVEIDTHDNGHISMRATYRDGRLTEGSMLRFEDGSGVNSTDGTLGLIVAPAIRDKGSGGIRVPKAQPASAYCASGNDSWEAWHYGFTRSAGTRSIGFGPGDGHSGIPSFVPERWAPAISRAAQRWNVGAALLAAQLWQESRFNPFARSSAGAQGIAQFMPGTAKAYNLTDPFDGDAAILAQAHLMHDLLVQFGSVPLALAAYNAGPGAVSRCGCIPQIPETIAYVSAILGLLGGTGDPAALATGLKVRLVA